MIIVVGLTVLEYMILHNFYVMNMFAYFRKAEIKRVIHISMKMLSLT